VTQSSSARLAPKFRALTAASALVLAACGGPGGDAEFPPVAKSWYDRGNHSFRTGDLEDAELAVENALRAAPGHEDTRVLAGRVALAKLDYDRSIEHLRGIESTNARSVRGRALWYKGDVAGAATELGALVRDPDVHDGWALEIVKLARSGAGRHPFAMSGGMLAATEMIRTGTAYMIVEVEIDGDPALAMISTGTAESVIDARAGAQPSWVSLRFGQRDPQANRDQRRVEVRDVPVLPKDLSGLSRQVNAPVKLLIGVNLLRHLKPTIDFAGSQFVVRNFDPPPPPSATTLKISYARGGGMMVRGALGGGDTPPACSLLVDTALPYPLALEQQAWAKAGVKGADLKLVPNAGSMRGGVLPSLRLGAFDVPNVPGIEGDSVVKEREQGLDVDLDGLIGSGLLATFRITLSDGGRSMWLEDLPPEALISQPLPEVPDIPIEEFENGAFSEEEEAPKGGAKPKAAPKPAPKAPAGGAKTP
jgi:hypothetical protein